MADYRLYTTETRNTELDEKDLKYRLLDMESLGAVSHKIALIERLSDNSYIVANGLQFHEDKAIDWDHGHYFETGQLISARNKYLHCISEYVLNNYNWRKS